MKPEGRWQDFDDVPCVAKPVPGVTITEGMRVRDLPEWFRRCFVHHEGGYPDVRFANGSFVWLQWALDPTGLERVTETVLVPGDALLAWPNGGVKVRFACAERKHAAIAAHEQASLELRNDYLARRAANPYPAYEQTKEETPMTNLVSQETPFIGEVRVVEWVRGGEAAEYRYQLQQYCHDGQWRPIKRLFGFEHRIAEHDDLVIEIHREEN